MKKTLSIGLATATAALGALGALGATDAVETAQAWGPTACRVYSCSNPNQRHVVFCKTMPWGEYHCRELV